MVSILVGILKRLWNYWRTAVILVCVSEDGYLMLFEECIVGGCSGGGELVYFFFHGENKVLKFPLFLCAGLFPLGTIGVIEIRLCDSLFVLLH
jgi:hypothetical protein